MLAMPDIEIVAPGGSPEAIEAALANGAHAVYAGAGACNARVRARNLEPESIEGAAAYVHSFGARLHLALNVPVQAGTVADFADLLARAHLGGVDAVILRDPIVMEASRDLLPGLPLHASTQHGVATAAAACRARDLGCARAILARELSRDEIRSIARAVPGLEIEIFVYGALCFAVSGLCLMGEAVDGRSGNYGACCQACRLEYFDEADRSLGRIFSMKDLDLLDRLPGILEAGVRALKIEGRLKSPAYVGCVVRWLRTALSRTPPGLTPAERKRFDREISVIYSRPRCTGFFDGATNREELVAAENSGHQGLEIDFWSVRDSGRARRLLFTTPVPLSIRDGLRLIVASREGAESECHVAIEDMRDEKGRVRNRVETGEKVSVAAPGAGTVRRAFVHSAKLVENEYLAVERPIEPYLRPGFEAPVEYLEAGIARDALSLSARRGRLTWNARYPLETQPARGRGFAAEDARKFFPGAQCAIEPDLYVNPSLLRGARRRFMSELGEAFEAERVALARRLAERIGADPARFDEPDEVLLSKGPAAFSRVTGFGAGAVHTSGGDTFTLEPSDKGTTLRSRK